MLAGRFVLLSGVTNRRHRFLLGACWVALWLAAAWRLPAQADSALVLRQLDVGQGDAAIIRTPEGKTIVIDAGRNAFTVAQRLRTLGVDTIDLLIASHNHADHIGGMASVLGGFVVRAYLDNGVPHTTQTYQSTISAVQLSGAQYLQAARRSFAVGSANVQVLSLPPDMKEQNNMSVGVLITFGEFSALYPGDSEQRELEHWLRTDSIPRVTVLKVAHHGSWNGMSREWIGATSPKFALISVGARNSYGHPSRGVIDLLQSSGITVLRTDVLGTIELRALRDGTVAAPTLPCCPPKAKPARSRTRAH